MYFNIIKDYVDNIKGLKSYIDIVEKTVFIEEEVKYCKLTTDLIDWAIRDIGREKVEIVNLDIDSNEEEVDMDKLRSEINELKKKNIPIKKRIKILTKMLYINSYEFKDGSLNIIVKNWFLSKNIKEDIEKEYAKKKQKAILYEGTLMLLVTYFEDMLSTLLAQDLRHYSRIDISGKSISLSELNDLDDIKQAKNIIIHQEIEEIMKANPDEWIKHLTNKVKLEMGFLQENKEEFHEIMARRNLIVHNKGIINNYYLKRVSKKVKVNVKKGDKLHVDKQYIKTALSIMESIGLTILFEIYLKENISKSKLDELLELIYDNYLIKDEYNICMCLYSILLKSGKLKGDSQMYCKLNYWQCYKWLGIREGEIIKYEKDDYSSYKKKIYLPALALQERYDEFFEIYKQQDEIKFSELENWPIFKEVRKQEEYINIVAKRDKEIDEIALEEALKIGNQVG